MTRRLSVSNSLSGRHRELDQVPAVGDPTHIVQLGTGHRVSADEGQWRVAPQRRVAACRRATDAKVQIHGSRATILVRTRPRSESLSRGTSPATGGSPP